MSGAAVVTKKATGMYAVLHNGVETEWATLTDAKHAAETFERQAASYERHPELNPAHPFYKSWGS